VTTAPLEAVECFFVAADAPVTSAADRATTADKVIKVAALGATHDLHRRNIDFITFSFLSS
jgi:hypothetical protein